MRLQTFWSDYWFARPGELSVAVIRAGLGLSMILGVWLYDPGSYSLFLAAQDPALYQPWGILALLGRDIPSPLFFEICRFVCTLTAVTTIVGLFSRSSVVICLLTGLCVMPLTDCFQQSWSHAHNVVLLAFIGFAFVPCGDRYSLDHLIRVYRNQPMKVVRDTRYYFYGVLLAQFSVSMMFLNAGFWKLRRGGRYFGWVVSDNMRNLLITNRLVLGEDLPPHLYFIVTHEWAYKAVALGNILGQTVPFLSMFLIRRPGLRALCGFMFFVEFFGLGIVMRIWAFEWLPLAVVFFDWDAIAAWVKPRLQGGRAYATA